MASDLTFVARKSTRLKSWSSLLRASLVGGAWCWECPIRYQDCRRW